MNRARKERMREQMDGLDMYEHQQLFRVISSYTTNVTKTQTGVLVSSESLSDACLLEMEKLIQFFLDQRKFMDVDEVKRKSFVKNGQT
uniref:Uncharacterized protein n=1 Tax=viral metagenome TaxID=1070528 RepID=A0A6C0J3Y0_9ZZZZ